MSDDPRDIFNEPKLKQPPVMRAAYSDRMAWLMAGMSELAYRKFEDVDMVAELVRDLSGGASETEIRKKLNAFVKRVQTDLGDEYELLESILKTIGFELKATFNEGGTQAFMALRTEGDNPILVLAFRGTEAGIGDVEQTVKDIKTDLTFNLVDVPQKKGAKVHAGFDEAYEIVRDKILTKLSEFPDVPLYITGHSLGGALAIVTSCLNAKDSIGACYTFGSPRIGNDVLALDVKTPIYRVVNAADIVPRLPPAVFWYLVIVVVRLFPGTQWLVKFISDNFKGYVHYGDMRYLTQDAEVRLLCNPSFFERVRRLIPRLIKTRGKAAAQDHQISLYRQKLRDYALWRN